MARTGLLPPCCPGRPRIGRTLFSSTSSGLRTAGSRRSPRDGCATIPLQGASARHRLPLAPNLREPFRQNLLKLVRKFYEEYELVLALVPRTGAWRTFAGQDGLTTDAGY